MRDHFGPNLIEVMVGKLNFYPGNTWGGICGVFADHALTLYIWRCVKEEVERGEYSCVEAEEDEDKVDDFVGGRILLHSINTLVKTQPLIW